VSVTNDELASLERRILRCRAAAAGDGETPDDMLQKAQRLDSAHSIIATARSASADPAELADHVGAHASVRTTVDALAGRRRAVETDGGQP